MRKLILILIILSTITLASTLPTKSVVKIFASLATISYKYPWQTSKIYNYSGSGAIIEGNKILTSAHVVSGAVFIEVKKENDPKKYIAKIKYISHQADLAILEVVDSKFFDNTNALKLNTKVKHRDEVIVLGYPLGGNAISTTTGVISRIEYTRYVWSKENLLAIQIDAAINSGNSGGPAVNKNSELVGIAMQKLTKSSNIAYIVPSIIINTFLEDIKDGVVNGFDSNSTVTSKIENSSMKEFYGLTNGNGVLTTFVDEEEKNLKVNDIVLEIDGIEIANDGTIDSEFGRISYELALHKKQIGTSVNLKVVRDKKIITIPYELKYNTKLIPTEFSKKPRYVIFGGLAFTPLTRNYLTSINLKKAQIDMLFYKKEKTANFNEGVAWMQTIFPHKVNRGYSSGAFTVKSVDGIKVKNFNHFIELIDSSKNEFIVIDCIEKNRIVLNVKESRESFEELKKRYYLNSDRRVE